MPLTLSPPSFEHGQAIQRRYSCEGDDISPPRSGLELPRAQNHWPCLLKTQTHLTRFAPNASGFTGWSMTCRRA